MTPTLTQDYVIRDAQVQDAEQLASFFRMAYGDSSHECKDPEHVRMTIERGTTSWFVAAQGDRILGCGAAVPHPWNRTWEPCRFFTLPDCRSRCLGIRLYRTAVEAAWRHPSCDLVFGSPRSYGVYLMARQSLDTPTVMVGHDGGMHVANGQREYHALVVSGHPDQVISRIVPPDSAIAEDPFIQEEILPHLSFTTEVGEYPAPYMVGPVSEQRADAGECTFFYEYDPASPSQALQITNVAAPREDCGCVADALATFLAGFPEAEHVSACVLIDKEELIQRMRKMGFSITAYLPAWYACDGKRYDCVMLVKRGFTEEPAAHGTAEAIARFDRELNRCFA
jgi:hypothetical protein